MSITTVNYCKNWHKICNKASNMVASHSTDYKNSAKCIFMAENCYCTETVKTKAKFIPPSDSTITSKNLFFIKGFAKNNQQASVKILKLNCSLETTYSTQRWQILFFSIKKIFSKRSQFHLETGHVMLKAAS